MKVLLIGGGGREHALGWAITRSPACRELVSLPGNPGLATLGPTVEGISPTDVGAVAAFAEQQGFDLVVVGPEAPLAAGLADVLSARDIAVFGPTRAAARLESSKSFAKDVMDRAGVPTGDHGSFTDAHTAKDRLRRVPGPYVVKADGLAAGKGVLVTDELAAAERWVDRCLTGDFAHARQPRVVIEEYLDGPELSVFFLCDEGTALPLQPARDYKRLLDGDLGPNTGGMGSFSPVPDLEEGLVDRVRDEVALPVLRRMAGDGSPYRGFLYVGLALTVDGPKVIEFNCRLGDPETQAILPLLESDLLALMEAAASSTLEGLEVAWSRRAAVNVVLASPGYPEAPRTGDRITGLEGPWDPDEVIVFHAGTAHDGRQFITSGGRVASVVGLGDSIPEARANAYGAADTIRWPGRQFRTDIAGGTA